MVTTFETIPAPQCPREAPAPAQSKEEVLEYGLIAEEVAEIYPEVVVRGTDAQPAGVKYHMLPAMLLNEFQRQQRQLESRAARLAAQRRELERAAGPGAGADRGARVKPRVSNTRGGKATSCRCSTTNSRLRTSRAVQPRNPRAEASGVRRELSPSPSQSECRRTRPGDVLPPHEVDRLGSAGDC
jgi:hypothetical protein